MPHVPARAATRIRWPMVFTLGDADAALLVDAKQHFDFRRVYPGVAPALAHRTFLSLEGAESWAPGFLGIDWQTTPGEHSGALMDEFYAFMAMRVRVLEHEEGRRTVMRVERWSLPLATRMIQLLEVEPHGDGTALHYRVSYDVPGIFTLFHPRVAVVFRRWFESSLDGLGRQLAHLVDARAKAVG